MEENHIQDLITNLRNKCHEHEEDVKYSKYKCDKCNDTGWILIRNEDKAPTAIRCKCSENDRIEGQWRRAGLSIENRNLTFSNFEVWNESSQMSKENAIRYYKNFNKIKMTRQNSIIFCGQVGSGKTHLAIALALNFIQNLSIKVRYMSYRESIMELKQNILDCTAYNARISQYKMCEILLIDDLFKGKITDTEINIMYEIIDYRYKNNKPIIISSELMIDELIMKDEALGSRIFEMTRDYLIIIKRDKRNNYRIRI